jgi:hypothetical protein
MTCEDFRESYELYSLGLLEGEERAGLDEHLAEGCPRCRRHIQDAMAMTALMLAQAPDAVPPARLRRRVLASVGVQSFSWTWLAAAAAAAMLVLSLWMSLAARSAGQELLDARRQLEQTQAERDRLIQAFAFLRDPTTRQVNFGAGQPAPPRGNVYLHQQLGVLLIASNLRPLEPGRTYEMWTIPRGGAPRPAGLFQAAEDGTAVHVFAGPIDPSQIAAVAVSVEPASGSDQPTGAIVIQAAAGA